MQKSDSWVGEDAITASADYLKQELHFYVATGNALTPIIYTPTTASTTINQYDWVSMNLGTGDWSWKLRLFRLSNPNAASFQLIYHPRCMSSTTTLVDISRQSTAVKSPLSYSTAVTGLQPKINLISSPSSYNQCNPITLVNPTLITNSSNR